MGYYAAFKKNEIISFTATWMDLEIIVLSEVRQKDKVSYCLYMESKKVIQMNLQKDSHTQRMNLWLPGEKYWREGID